MIMKLLYTLRTAAARITLLIAVALVPTAAGAQSGSEPQSEMADKDKAEAKTLKDALMPTMLVMSADSKYSQRKYTEAFADYKQVSELGLKIGQRGEVAFANFRLGQMYELGFGVDVNETNAIKYYKLATAGGWTEAHYALGTLYNNNRDYADAVTELRLFAAKPDANAGDASEAHYMLGKIYAEGEQVPKDYALAVKEFATAANVGAGHNKARYELGMLYLTGNGVGQDYSRAAKYLEQAADGSDRLGGVGDAQYVLSTLYASGNGVTQSDVNAVKYLRMAAKRDHTKAQFGLGMMFAAGKGVPQSMPVAYLWIARAAEGDKFTRSLSESTKAQLAAGDGRAAAIKARDAIRAREGLTAEQLVKVQIVVDRCVADNDACNWGD
jgi:TPR repeat protein